LITPVNPPDWPYPSGYSHVVVGEGKLVAIAGQIGWDPIREELVSDDLAQQCRQAIANMLTALESAGGKAEHLLRLTWYITDRDAYLKNAHRIEQAYREEVGEYYPAMSVVVVSGLLEPRAKVQIEATALIEPKRRSKTGASTKARTARK